MGWTCSILGNKNLSHGVWFVNSKDRWGSLGYQVVDVKLFKVNIKASDLRSRTVQIYIAHDVM